jgi:hypothetical protein
MDGTSYTGAADGLLILDLSASCIELVEARGRDGKVIFCAVGAGAASSSFQGSSSPSSSSSLEDSSPRRPWRWVSSLDLRLSRSCSLCRVSVIQL